MYFFYWSHRQLKSFIEGKHCLNSQKCFNNKKLAALRSQHHVRRHCSQFFIVETLLTVTQQCFTSKWRTSQWRWSKKKKKSPYDCKNACSVPPHPRVAALRCVDPLQPQHPKKMRKKRSQLLHSPAYWPSLRFAQRTLIIDHSTSLTHHALYKKSYNLHCKQRQFVADAINRGVKANFSILQLFYRVWTMVYIKMKDFTMTVIKKKGKKSLWL